MSRRERLRSRRLPPTPVTLRVDFSAAADAAHRGLEEARRALLLAEARGADLAEFEAGVQAAEAVAAPYVEVLNVYTIAPDLYEAIVGEHPPSDEDRAKGAQWNPVTFVPALLAACIDVGEPDPMTAQDWAEFAAVPNRAALGELSALLDACLRANDRSPDVHVGKGFGAGILS